MKNKKKIAPWMNKKYQQTSNEFSDGNRAIFDSYNKTIPVVQNVDYDNGVVTVGLTHELAWVTQNPAVVHKMLNRYEEIIAPLHEKLFQLYDEIRATMSYSEALLHPLSIVREYAEKNGEW